VEAISQTRKINMITLAIASMIATGQFNERLISPQNGLMDGKWVLQTHETRLEDKISLMGTIFFEPRRWARQSQLEAIAWKFAMVPS
jgi:hypothetical protein